MTDEHIKFMNETELSKPYTYAFQLHGFRDLLQPGKGILLDGRVYEESSVTSSQISCNLPASPKSDSTSRLFDCLRDIFDKFIKTINNNHLHYEIRL